MKSRFKLLKLPDNDHINACINTFISEGLNHPDLDQCFAYQEKVILALIDHYGQWPDDIYCAHLHNNFLGLYQTMQQYFAPDSE